MAVSCDNCPLRRRKVFKDLSKDELAFMNKFKMGELQVEAGATVILEGSSSPHFHTVLSGSGTRNKMLPDGRKQVLNFIFPGDLIGLQAGLLGDMKHGVDAVTDMTLCVFSRERIWSLFKQHPDRAFDLTWLAATEIRTLGEMLLSVGQRTAKERLAAVLLYLMQRGVESGYAQNETQMRFPYRQQDLADASGLSLVHTNKTIQALRRAGLIRLEDKVLQILNGEKLAEIAMVDETELTKGRPLL